MQHHAAIQPEGMLPPNIIEALPLEILEEATFACDSDSLLQWRLCCSLGRRLANSVASAVTLSGAHLASTYFRFSKLGASTFPRLRTLKLVDSPDVAVTDNIVITVADHVLENVQNLDLKGCSYLSSALGVHSLLSLTPNLQQFVATRWMDAGGLLAVAHLKQLQKLELGDDKLDCLSVDDPALRVVATCTSTSLRSLSLARCTSITDAGVAALAQLHQLQDLDISGCTRVTGVISAAPGAQEVMQAGDSALATTSSLPGGLHVLTLKGCTGFSDQGLIKLAQAGGVSSLKSINLGGSGVTNTGLEALTQAPHLTQVCLGSDYEVTRVGLGHLGACTALTHLTLGNFNISPPTPGVTPPPPPHMGSQSPSGFPALTYLEFGGSFFNRGLRHVFPLGSHLSHIHATTTSAVHDAFMPHLARQTSLTTLTLHGGYQLTTAGVQALTSLPQLHTLQLSACPLVTQEALVPVLAHMKSPPTVTFLPSGPAPPAPHTTAGGCTPAASPLTHSSSLPSLSALSSGPGPASPSGHVDAAGGGGSSGGAGWAQGTAGCSMT